MDDREDVCGEVMGIDMSKTAKKTKRMAFTAKPLAWLQSHLWILAIHEVSDSNKDTAQEVIERKHLPANGVSRFMPAPYKYPSTKQTIALPHIVSSHDNTSQPMNTHLPITFSSRPWQIVVAFIPSKPPPLVLIATGY